MSLTALRQAAFSSRRVFTLGSEVGAKRADGRSDTRTDKDLVEVDGAVALEPHWQASIETATD